MVPEISYLFVVELVGRQQGASGAGTQDSLISGSFSNEI